MLPLNELPLTLGLLALLLTIPPPLPVAVFAVNVQSVTVGLLLMKLYIPPPEVALLSLNVQPATSGPLLLLNIPPPLTMAVFPLNVQPITVGLLLVLSIPPPNSACPPVIVKPSRTVSTVSLLMHKTTVPSPTPSLSMSPLMMVTSGPSELRTVIALPRKLMSSR